MTSPHDIDALAERLSHYSHGPQGLDIIQEYLRSLGEGGAERQERLASHLLCGAIRYDDVHERYPAPEDAFHVLQGDIVRVEQAFILGTLQKDASRERIHSLSA